MKITNRIFYAILISVLLVIIHLTIDHFKPGDTIMLVSSLGLMIAAQLAAFLLLKKDSKNQPLTFTGIFISLALTQVCIVLLLAINSAFNPLVDFKPLNFSEILMSLLIFGIAFPLILCVIIWFLFVKRNHNVKNQNAA